MDADLTITEEVEIAICWYCGQEHPVEYAQTSGVVRDDHWYDSELCSREGGPGDHG